MAGKFSKIINYVEMRISPPLAQDASDIFEVLSPQDQRDLLHETVHNR